MTCPAAPRATHEGHDRLAKRPGAAHAQHLISEWCLDVTAARHLVRIVPVRLCGKDLASMGSSTKTGRPADRGSWSGHRVQRTAVTAR